MSSIHKNSSGVMASGIMRSSDDYDPTKRFPKARIEGHSKLIKDRQHPTQKPTSLMEYLIKTYSNKGDMVLDFAMGSGTTGVGCKKLGRNFIGIEKDRVYFKIAKERIKATQPPLRLKTKRGR